MSAENNKEQAYFIFPEGVKNLKKLKNMPDIELAIKNIEKIFKQPIDNTIDFVEIETNSLNSAMKEGNLDIVLNLLPTFLRDVGKLLNKVKK